MLLVLGALLVVVLSVFLATSDDFPSSNMGGKDGKLGGEFTLTGIDGEVSLSDFRGKVVMLYFGFVNCSQVCPTSMRIMQKTLAEMDSNELGQVQAILISFDTEDSYQTLAAYTKKFHPNILGLTGTVKQINTVIDEYGAYYGPNDLEEFDAGLAYRHSSRYYIVNQQGELVDAMRHSTTANELRARLRTLI